MTDANGTKKTRYALVLSLQKDFDENKATKWIDEYLKNSELDGDKNNPEKDSFLVIYTDFDKVTGKIIPQKNGKPFYSKMIGSQSGYYAGSDGISQGDIYTKYMKSNPVVASTILYWPFCTAFEQVFNSSVEIGQGLSTNKAWTNRVWSAAPEATNLDIAEKVPTRSTTFAPYATISLRTGDTKQEKLANYPFQDFIKDGRPLACNDKLVKGFGGILSSLADDCISNSGAGYGKLPGYADYTDYLFAYEFNKYVIQDNNAAFKDQLAGSGKDLSDKMKGNQAPKIYSLNPATCFTAGIGKTTCSAGEVNNFTVKQRNATNKDYDLNGIPDEDPSKKGNEEAHISTGGFFFADAKFFAFADDNQMPIKRVMVNWGDDMPVTNMDTYGRYKNHKPYCAASEGDVVGLCGKAGVGGKETTETPSLLTCATDKECGIVDPSFVCLMKDHKDPTHKLPGKLKDQDAFDVARFGNMPRACEATYFDFAHVYTCSKGNKYRFKVSDPANKLSPATKGRLAAHGVKDSDEVCVYKPGVQILDNWDWCNGIDNVLNNNFVGRHLGACNFASEPTNFTPYKGQIVVVPEKQ